MSHIRIDKQKAVKKWTPVLENMGVTGDRVEWMSELAEFHSINENAYANATTAGMGGVSNPVLGTLPGALGGGGGMFGPRSYDGIPGSGDLGQNLLPVAMKIAAQTIGLDLVAVKPTPGPKIDLLYIDFQYDDLRNGDTTGRPQVFKITVNSNLVDIKAVLNAGIVTAGGRLTQGGLDSARLWVDGIDASGALVTNGTEPTSKTNVLEFLGFSRIDGAPMFRAYRQSNATGVIAGNGGYPFHFEPTLNTFGPTGSMVDAIQFVGTATASGSTLELVSALEDHLPGFSANWASSLSSGDYPMGRQQDDDTYSGVIGPKISSKSVAVGTIEVSTALRRTEIEDIKANTGMDIVQKMESILVNELSQTISRQIVKKVFELGDANRATAPAYGGSASFGGGSIPAINGGVASIFDLDTSYVLANGGIGGETTHAVQRKLITKLAHASNYIATEGRIGPAQFAITNGGLAASLMDIAGYTVNPVKSKLNGQGQLYPVGTIGEIQIYVDPYQRYNDNRIVLGRKNNPDQPGLIFVPYLMAQSISVISEATFAPRMLLRSRYAITDVGFFPEKQFMAIYVVDQQQFLN